MKLWDQPQPHEYVGMPGFGDPAQDHSRCSALGGQVIRRTGKGAEDPNHAG